MAPSTLFTKFSSNPVLRKLIIKIAILFFREQLFSKRLDFKIYLLWNFMALILLGFAQSASDQHSSKLQTHKFLLLFPKRGPQVFLNHLQHLFLGKQTVLK